MLPVVGRAKFRDGDMFLEKERRVLRRSLRDVDFAVGREQECSEPGPTEQSCFVVHVASAGVGYEHKNFAITVAADGDGSGVVQQTTDPLHRVTQTRRGFTTSCKK